tara:strand:+ start:273 stop:602 length:330 start_codon:yes stop_codon:yes gene_type:complete
MKDSCYEKIKASYEVFPSARASQAIAKCRKHSGGKIRKTAAGAALKRWKAEKWVNTKTGKPCGQNEDRHSYCRPTVKRSSKTPVLRGSKLDKKMQSRKQHGERALNRRR